MKRSLAAALVTIAGLFAVACGSQPNGVTTTQVQVHKYGDKQISQMVQASFDRMGNSTITNAEEAANQSRAVAAEMGKLSGQAANPRTARYLNDLSNHMYKFADDIPRAQAEFSQTGTMTDAIRADMSLIMTDAINLGFSVTGLMGS